MKMLTKMYLHSDKETNSEFINELIENNRLNMSESSKENFRYTLYEVEFDVDIDIETGDVEILKVNGKELGK